jgi:hypothetical protein
MLYAAIMQEEVAMAVKEVFSHMSWEPLHTMEERQVIHGLECAHQSWK